MAANSSKKMGLLGFGFDHSDGHTRVTRGDNFHLMGGSEETHGEMQEQCIHFNEKLNSSGKSLEQLEREEFLDMAADCGMNIISPGDRRDGKRS